MEPRRLLATGGVTYQGGAVINNVAVETVFLGQAWATDPSLVQNAAQLDQFFGSVTNSSYMDVLAQYGTPQAGPIGQGSFVGQINVTQDVWRRSIVSDGTIQSVLNSEIAMGAIAPPDSNRLLFVFTPPNVVVSQGGSRSDGYPTGFAGYHNSFVDSAGQLVRYAVIPDPIGNDQVAGLTTFQQQTAAASHEMAEAVTDPDGASWWDSSNDATSGYEIADFANLNTDIVYLNGYAVEDVWSNAGGGIAAPAGATLTPTPILTPPPIPIPTPSIPPPSGGTPAPSATSNLPANLSAVSHALTHDANYEASLITTAYQQYLERPADAAGISYWISQIQAGTTDEQFEALLLSSSEYAQLHGGGNASWVLGMYSDLLQRPADGDGLSYWLNQLTAGETRYQIALGIATSAEREAIVVANDYQTLLGRAAAAGEIAFWVNAFEQGASNEDLVADFIASPEYYNASNKGQSDRIAWLDSVFNDLYQTTPTTSDLSYWLGQLG